MREITENGIDIIAIGTNFCRFGELLPYGSPQELDCLSEELTEFQLLEEEDIPEQVRTEATVFEDKQSE